MDARTAVFLEGGPSLIVGTVAPDGEPFATRGWGLTVLPGAEARLRLLVAADEHRTLSHLRDGGGVAITAADVRTLRSIQLKGRALAVEAATEDDRARAGRFAEAFFADVHESDGTPLRLLERLVPSGYAACIVTVDELFDQTPGPGAGLRVDGPRS